VVECYLIGGEESSLRDETPWWQSVLFCFLKNEIVSTYLKPTLIRPMQIINYDFRGAFKLLICKSAHLSNLNSPTVHLHCMVSFYPVFRN